MFIKFLKILIIFFSSITDAFAYLDPGTVNIITQILVAIIATIAFYFRAFIAFIKSILNKIIIFFNKKNDF